MRFHDGCLGVDEGKVVPRVIVNVGWCIFLEFLDGADVNFGTGAF